jgi:hypothetical protein
MADDVVNYDLNATPLATWPKIVGESTNSAPTTYYENNGQSSSDASEIGVKRDLGNVPKGAERTRPVPVINSPGKKDLRVRIKVPQPYLSSKFTTGAKGQLASIGGIIFPYTPSISFEHKADYAQQTPTHSNYAINFYKGSSVSDIQISGLFTVQNDQDAINYISTIHLLRSLTKMGFGNETGGIIKGSPPPVCRLFAYGNFMLENVPVAITSFKTDLPVDADSYWLNDATFDEAFIPTRSTISVTCRPMYSRNEMLSATVSGYLNDVGQRTKGIL